MRFGRESSIWIAPALLTTAIMIAAGCGKSDQARLLQAASGRHPARPRIVSLAPSITETLFALGAGSEVVGVSEYCDYPPVALKLPKVGTFLTPNIEAIVALRPTLVIGLEISSGLREIHAVNAMGVPTIMISDDSIAQIEAAIRRIGDELGRTKEADKLVDEIQQHIRAVEEQLKGVPARRVLMLVGHQPIVAVGRGTFLDELLELARATNIADASWQPWPQLGIEYIIASRPEVILDGQMGSEASSPGGFWGRYPSIPAVKHNRVYGYPQSPTLHSGPRVWQTLAILARLIHPEAFHHGSVTLAPSPTMETAR